VAFLRSWEANPPVEFPPEVAIEQVSLSGDEIYQDLCAQCHGSLGEGGIGPALGDPQFQETNSDQEIFDTINLGHEATAMIAWGEILSAEQIQELVLFIRQMKPLGEGAAAGPPTFSADVLPIFDAKCVFCHGNEGGWDGSSYQTTVTTGDNAPVVIPGDPENSLLAQKMVGTHTEGAIMPPGGKLPEDQIQVIIDWIEAGALE
jgi:cbb3-type cytochrome c oxidase subunit III